MSDKFSFGQIEEKYQALEIRHRLMIAGLVLAVLLVIFDFAWYQPQDAEQLKIKRELASVQNQRKELSSAIEQRQQELMGTAFNNQRKEIEQLRVQEKNLDQQLSQYAQLVSPRQMPGLLKDIFEKSKTLELLALEKHKVKPAFETVNAEGAAANSTDNSGANNRSINFYRHDFTVTLEGRYFELLESLKTLEQMKLKIYWESLDYQVTNYPNAEIKLTIYTFSYDKDWIGA